MSNVSEVKLSPSEPPAANDWHAAIELLRSGLASNGGCMSSRALRQALSGRGLGDPRGLVVKLTYYNFDAPTEDGLEKPSFRWFRHAKSFYTQERFERLQRETEVVAEQAEQTVPGEPVETAEDEEEVVAREPRRYRQEERRLGTYVASALENIYQSDHSQEDCSYVFDVHNDRAGSEFENVDVIAVHWRSTKNVELIAVEVKLDFTARLVQQAKNYGRFCERVWLAVPVLADATDAAAALRDFDPLLFEHVVDCGLGILACRRRPGRSYEVLPVQWPRRMSPDAVEKELFLERYRGHFEQAGVLEPKTVRRFPYPRVV